MGQQLSRKHIASLPEKYPQPSDLHEDHLKPSKLQRFKRGQTFAERARSALFNTADDILDEVYADLCNGVSRSDVTQKLMKGCYKAQKREMSYRQAQEYWNCALDRMHYNTDIELAELKDIFYNRYEALLETAVKKGDIYNARAILDSMSKTFLGVGSSQNNIQINNNKDGIVIKFGFSNDDESEQDFEEINDEDSV